MKSTQFSKVNQIPLTIESTLNQHTMFAGVHLLTATFIDLGCTPHLPVSHVSPTYLG